MILLLFARSLQGCKRRFGPRDIPVQAPVGGCGAGRLRLAVQVDQSCARHQEEAIHVRQPATQ